MKKYFFLIGAFYQCILFSQDGINRDLLKEQVETTNIVLQEDTSYNSNPMLNPIDTRQLSISAIFFEANVTEMKERGINWEAIFSKSGMIINPNFRSRPAIMPEGMPNFSIGTEIAGDVNKKFSVYTNSVINFFQTENMGHIIAKLSLTVNDHQKGRMQVGSDFSIKQVDFAGNVIDRFYPAGTIMEVIPKIYKTDSLYYALLKLNAEKSFAEPNLISTIVRKTSAETEVLLFDNEEAVVGGLLTTEEITVRGGIPFFKDLPWWVLGLKYLTGYDKKILVEKEVIILVKIEIIPALKERMMRANEDLLKNKLREERNELEKYKKDLIKE